MPRLLLGCDNKISLRMLDNHLSQQHTFGQVCKRRDGWTTVMVGFRPQDLQKVNDGTAGNGNKLYWVKACQFDDGGGKVYANFAAKDKMLFSGLTLVCSPSQAKCCLGTIKLSHPTTKHYHTEMLCPVTSIDTPPSEVMESGNYLTVTGHCLEKAVDPPNQDGFQSVKVAFKIVNI